MGLQRSFSYETVLFRQRRCTLGVGRSVCVGGGGGGGGGESLRSLTPRCEEIIQIGPKA